MRKSLYVLFYALVLSPFFFIFRKWFGDAPLSAGDWSYHAASEIARFNIFPQAWRFDYHTGLGANGVFITSLETYFLATAKIFYLITGFPWAISERVIWYIPFLLVGICSSFILCRTILPKSNAIWLAPLIFLTNTYILIVSGGGQMGIGMAYACAPLVLASFIRLYEAVSLRQSLIAGLLLAVITGFDPRISFILAMGIFVYWITMLLLEKKTTLRKLFYFVLSFFVMLLLHAFWLVPLVLFKGNPIESLGAAYSSLGSVIFFSFGDFSHSLSLLHPNWPENIFGKVYFLQPEFLVVPIFAWVGFLAIKDAKKSLSIICFGLIAIVGIFLSKGAKGPGGDIYLWMFGHIPGFNVFRDPTKFYLLIVLAYSIMIPATVDWMTKKMPRGMAWKALPSLVFVLFWLFTIRQAVFGQLSGTFLPHTKPNEYDVLQTVIDRPDYFRTFWIPHTQRYGFEGYMHPVIDAGTVLDTSTPSAMLAWVNSKEGVEQLSHWSVKYVILPYDSQGEMFLDDRKYSQKLRDTYQIALDANNYLKKVTIPGLSSAISVYETPGYRDHLWIAEAPDEKVWWQMNSSASYTVKIPISQKPLHLVFTETFDPYWQMTFGSVVVGSKKTKDGLNSFALPTDRTVTGLIEYVPQTYVGYGVWVSAIVLVVTVLAVIFL